MSDTIEATIYTVWDGNGRFWASDDGVEQPVGWISHIEMADWFQHREEAEGFAEEVGGHVISKTEAEAADKPTPPKVVKSVEIESAEDMADLRDHFAAQALAGYVAAHAGDGVGLPDFDRAAKWAYGCADAMIDQRAKTRKQG